MSNNTTYEVSIVLENIFNTCDVEEKGAVESEKLINFLISQVVGWQENIEVKEELKDQLHCSESPNLITKEYFISSLLNWLKNSEFFEEAKRNNRDEMSTSTNDDWYSNKIKQASSLNSFGDNFNAVCYVSDGDTFSNEEFLDNNGSPRTPRLMSELREKVDSLQRKNESLERENGNQLAQISSLEDELLKKRKESHVASQKLAFMNQSVAMQKQELEETEEKLFGCLDEKNLIRTQLFHLEQENFKLNELIKNFENQNLESENSYGSKKNQDLYNSLKTLKDDLYKSEKELEMFKIKENRDQGALEKVQAENLILKQQKDSNLVIIQELKLKLKESYKRLSELRSEKVTSRLQPKGVSDGLSDDDSKTVFDENFSLDSTIPLEDSLYAELEDELVSDVKGCVCELKKGFSSYSSKFINTESSETSDIAVNTEYYCGVPFVEEKRNETNIELNGIGFNDSIKISENDCEFCHLKSKRSSLKWMIIALLLLVLTFMVGFFTSFFIILNVLKHSTMSAFCLPTASVFLQSSDLLIPI